MWAKASGLFRHHKEKPKVGDYVEYQLMNDTTAYITKLNPRFNDLVRPAICNIDQAFVVFSVKDPDFNTNLLDRFLTILNFNNIEAILIFTKWDLLTKEETIEIKKYQDYYQKIGYSVLTASKNDNFNETKKEIIDLLKNKITVITGQSGAGKSTFLNALVPSLNLKTGDFSFSLGRGKHTTREVEFLEICDGLVADTPGFSSLSLNIDIERMSCIYPGFNHFGECKFRGCKHDKEIGCKIKDEVNEGIILKESYDNYLKILNDIKKGGRK